MLVELGGQLDEIGGDAGAGDHRIGDVRQQPVQAVAELVEQGAGIVEGEQRRRAAAGLGEVHHVDDERPDVARKLLLDPQRRHPGAAALRGSGEIVAEEQADMAVVRAADLPDPHVGMPHRDVVALVEGEAEQPAGGVEGRRDHAVEREIGRDLGLIDVEARLAQLLRVEAPVPGREREVAALGLGELLERIAVGHGAGPRRRPHALEQPAHRLRGLRHGIVEAVAGKVGVAQQAGALGAQPHRLGDDRLVVGRARRRRRGRSRRGRPFHGGRAGPRR